MYEFPRCVSSEDRDTISSEEIPSKQEIKFKIPTKKAPKKDVAKNKRVMTVLEAARYEMWREHRHRLQNVVSDLDKEPPSFQAVRLTGVNKLRDQAVNYMQRTKENIHMLLGLSQTMRTHGAIKPFRYESPNVMSAVPGIINNLEKMEQDNHDLGMRILDVVSEVDSGLKTDGHTNKQPTQPFTMPDQALAKYKPFNIKLPSTDKERWQLFRPRIYFDIYLKEARPLGRFVVQLYTEAAPVVVLQLVRACMCNMHNKFFIKRLFPGLWLDVELPTENNAALHRPLEYDGKIIDHGVSNYVLSFSKTHLQGFRDNLSFSISFKPLQVVNGSRVGFGRVIKGSKIFECLQSYGTKNGTLSRGIICTSCGVL
ncbi:uncharacterized protein LOC115764455 [Drosophila novamexicana]|uniref:uncharacterized protein LOC115764455 n=1 Tax=Drosophila novamexicana TaxID=47314 RepID=UPI0011E58F74|nr:uncharacterized protein LOC115764455 [Drosophila novamexicana]